MQTPISLHRASSPVAIAMALSGSVMAAVLLYIDLGGSVTAAALAEARSYRVSSAQTARLASVEVTEGQVVATGEVVARLDTSIVQKEISVARAGIDQAAAEVKAAGMTIDSNQQETERSFRSELEQAEVALKAAWAEQARDQASLAPLTAEVNRERGLLARGLVRADRLTQLEISLASLEETVRNWPVRIAAIEARWSSALARLHEWQASHSNGPGGTKSAQMLPIRDRVMERRQSLELLHTRMESAVLRATVRSFVSMIHARPGDVVNPGDPIVTLVELQPKQIVAYVDERRMDLREGTAVIVRRGDPERAAIRGTVTAVGADVVPVPQRLWSSPHLPSWGRAVYISVPDDSSIGPGERVEIRRPYTHQAIKPLLTRLWPRSAGAY